jgi:hypothetical protein
LALHKERGSRVVGIKNQERSGFWLLTENDLYRRKGDMRSRVIVGPEVQ